MTYIPRTNQLIRELGPMPAEGAWFPIGPTIMDHNALCCDEANELMIACPGTYRAPGEIDLENIRQAIYHRNKDGRWRGVDGANTEAFQARVRELMDEEEQRKALRLALYEDVISEAINPIISGMTPRVIGGTNKPRHTVPFSPQNVENIQDLIASVK